MKSKLFFIGIAACFLAGCATTYAGHDIDVNKLDQITIGETTKDEVVNLIGTPGLTKIGEGETEIWEYTYLKPTGTRVCLCLNKEGKDVYRRYHVSIVFDKNGIVQDMLF